MMRDTTATDFIEAEDYSGSGYETNESGGSETTSLASSLQHYLEENGRRYHAYYGPDKNLMPTDEVSTIPGSIRNRDSLAFLNSLTRFLMDRSSKNGTMLRKHLQTPAN